MNEHEFADILFKGLGRAYLHLQQHDSTPYRDVLYAACRYNLVYDAQCEGSRTHYYYELLQLLPDHELYERELLANLANPDDEMDVYQLFEFALLFAQQGNTLARHVMYECCGEYASIGCTAGADELIALDEFDGFLFVAERLGTMSDEPDVLYHHPLYALEEQVGAATMRQLLDRARQQHPALQRYLERVECIEAQRKHAEQPHLNLVGQPYAQIKQYFDLVSTQRPVRGRLFRWARQASDDDIIQAAHDLLKQTSTPIITVYLTIFQKRAFPLEYSALVPLVWHTEEDVASLAIRCLALLQAPGLRQLGLELLEKNQHVGKATGLVMRNFQTGDEQVIAAVLDRTRDLDEVHDIGWGLKSVFEDTLIKEAAPLLVVLYERGPCSLCRFDFVKWLVQMQCAPVWMLHECRYDADERTRALAYQHQET